MGKSKISIGYKRRQRGLVGGIDETKAEISTAYNALDVFLKAHMAYFAIQAY
ncbi:hypothetical protein SDC9_55638 [bioreactor metagenome]|uniref:Uncharacterized protein n=1 Tax=bioreactor metagenome TaxID=1076179 RepID=A0A644WZN8_9ZZZZ